MVGDRIQVQSRVDGQEQRQGEILEVRGENGEPPYFVRFDDGYEQLVYPGPDVAVQPAISED